MKLVQLILNVLWVVFCGFWMALGYLLAAIICFVLIVTIPFGIASLRIMRLRAVAIRADHRGAARRGCTLVRR